MDIDGWEYLPDHGYLDFNEVGGENQIFFGKRNNAVSEPKTSTTTTVFDMNYFCTSPKSKRATEKAESWNNHNQRVPSKKQLVHVPIQLEPTRIGHTPDEGLLAEQSTKTQEKITKESSKVGGGDGGGSVFEQPLDQDTVSQVFFMKMDSPKSGSSRGFFPPLDPMRFEDKGEALVTSPRLNKVEKEMIMMDYDDDDDDEKEEEGDEKEFLEDSISDDDDGGNFNLWKWGLSGVGAIFSFGVAAATICVLFFGSQQRNKLQQEQKIRFQIYTDDKRLKQVVQHATKLNEAISAVSRAHITYGGYYDGL